MGWCPPCGLDSCPWLEASLTQERSSKTKDTESQLCQWLVLSQHPHQHSLLPTAPARCRAAEELMVTPQGLKE